MGGKKEPIEGNRGKITFAQEKRVWLKDEIVCGKDEVQKEEQHRKEESTA
jgi:hypothetical protein